MTAKEFLALRKSTGLSQERFGWLLGVSYQTVRKWERGEIAIRPVQEAGICTIVERHQKAQKQKDD